MLFTIFTTCCAAESIRLPITQGHGCRIGEVWAVGKNEVQEIINPTTAEWPIANVHITE